MMMQGQVPIVWREQAFTGDLHRHLAPVGLTVAEIVHATPRLDATTFGAFGIVTLDGNPIERRHWHLVRPKAGVIVNLVVAFPQKGSFGKILRTVATIAVAAIAIAAVPYLTPFIGAPLAAIAGLGISIGGTLAISALTPPPQLAGPQASTALTSGGIGDSGDRTASLAGNVLRPGGPIPRVLGTHRVFPPLAAPALIDLEDDDEVVEGVFILAGPHKLENIRNGDTSLDDIDDVEYQTREGWEDDLGLTLITRQSKTNESGISLSEHTVSDESAFQLKSQATPEDYAPKWHRIDVKGSPDEIWLNFALPQGILNQSDPTGKMGLPIRIRMRPSGETAWTFLPELHLNQSRGKAFQKQVKIIFGSAVAAPTAKTDRAFTYAQGRVPMRTERLIGASGWTGNLYILHQNIKSGSNIAYAVSGASRAYIGFNFAAFPRVFTDFELWPSAGSGFAATDARLSKIEIYGKANSTLPSGYSDGNVLFTYNGADTTSPITKANCTQSAFYSETTEYHYIWVVITTTNTTDVYITNFRLFDNGDWSWKASDYFLGSAEITTNVSYMNATSQGAGTCILTNMGLYYESAKFYLDTPDFEKGDYEIEVMRGCPYTVSAFTTNSYAYRNWGDNDQVYVSYTVTGRAEFFKYSYGYLSGSNYYVRATNANNYTDDCQLSRVSRIWNEPVLSTTGLATIAVKSRRRRLESINLDASGYVDRWSGTAFDDNGISSNPVDHFRDVLVGDLNASALPEDLIDDAALIEWRAHCVAMGYTCNMVVEGRTAFDVLNTLGGCGRARPRQSDKWSIMYDRDRSGETPVQVWSPANMRGFNWTKAFNRLPAGLRVRYKDSSNNYQENEIIVLRPGAEDDGRYEDMPYDGIVTETDATARATFDLAQMTARPVFYQGEVPLNHLVAERGDLVAVQYDTISAVAGWGRIRSILRSAGAITGVVLDGSIQMNTAGYTGMTIIGKNGSHYTGRITTGTSADETTSVDFVTPFTDPGTSVIDEGCHVVAGAYGSESKRLVLSTVTPKPGMVASVVMLDEAPEIHDNQDPIILETSYTPIYYGAVTDAVGVALDNAEVLALTTILGASGFSDTEMTFDCTGGKYPCIVFPTAFGTLSTITVDGLSFNDFTVEAMTVTDVYGDSAAYSVLRWNTIQYGSSITASIL